jgi:inosine/xanthosine triphosphate pyrophosphatase family protein
VLASKALGSKAKFVSVIAIMETESGAYDLYRGECCGTIVLPSGDEGFGWDCIFKPDGYDQTYAQMGVELKSRISARTIAASAARAAWYRQ